MKYSFCETMLAFTWHIRPLTDAGLKLSGGADSKTLCGLKPSWDVVCSINPKVLNGTQHLEGCCHVCAKEYLKLISAD